MTLVLASLGLLLAGAGLALLTQRRERLLTGVVLTALVTASAAGLGAAVPVLAGGAAPSLRLPWSLPLGSFSLGLDPLSALFLLPILVLAPVAGIYGTAYLRAWRGRRNVGVCWFFYLLLVACMVLVVVARDAMLFLVAWEAMALAAYALVVFEDERPEVRRAGRITLVATHLASGTLLVMFLLLGQASGSLEFAGLRAGPVANLAFALAVIGFGTKAGLVPLHVWLPEAHPASASHVSALMSGAMIKTGIYGLLRVLTFLGPPPAAWGWTLLAIGIVTGILGALLALAQHDLKRVLAYSSVENIGIIALGIGLGLLGRAHDLAAMTFLGFAGALLHVVNHALFKGLLFLGAGAAAQATHTRALDQLGGLLKRMPRTGALFLVGAAAICGLPPLNGLVGELVIYLGALQAITTLGTMGAAAGAIAVIGLALIGGLAAAVFARVFGIAFLGEPRTEAAARATETGWFMIGPMGFLAAGCVILGLAGPLLIGGLLPVVTVVAGPAAVRNLDLAALTQPLRMVSVSAAVLLLALAALALLRRTLLARRSVTTSVTWDCGYAAPTARMQYTAASFARPLTDLFSFALRTRCEIDPVQEGVYAPIARAIGRLAPRRRWLQSGQTQVYVLYIAVTLLALLVWKLG